MARPQRKRRASESSERNNGKRRKIEVRGEEEKAEASKQDNNPCLDDAPPVPNIAKAQKRKRQQSCESSTPNKRRTMTNVRTDFTYHKVLGSGSYGKVLLASHKKTKTMVAVKVATKKKVIKDCPDNIKIEREVLELVNDSPFFTHLHQSFQSEEHLYYVMEYLRGGSLSQLIESRGKFDTDTVRRYAADLACALSYLHSKRIIHRDLKPDNILIGNDGHLKVADFGLSAILPVNRQNMTGWAGTVGYLAPEVLSFKRYNFAVDWFSYGAILYYLATGKEPFKAKTERTMIGRTIRCSPKYPDDMDRDLKDLLENLLIKNGKRRLGAHNIRNHRFFRNINWADVEQRNPNIPIYTTDEEAAATEINERDLLPEEEGKLTITPYKNKIFAGFSFLSPSWRPP